VSGEKSRAPDQIGQVGTIIYQAVAEVMRVDGRQCIFGGERDDLTLIGLVKGVRYHHENLRPARAQIPRRRSVVNRRCDQLHRLIFSEMSLGAGIAHALADASRRDIAELCPAVVTRESGRFSIPEMLAMESRGRSVQDTPHARGMTTPCGADYSSRIAE
jgi:hypothetical protein